MAGVVFGVCARGFQLFQRSAAAGVAGWIGSQLV